MMLLQVQQVVTRKITEWKAQNRNPDIWSMSKESILLHVALWNKASMPCLKHHFLSEKPSKLLLFDPNIIFLILHITSPSKWNWWRLLTRESTDQWAKWWQSRSKDKKKNILICLFLLCLWNWQTPITFCYCAILPHIFTQLYKQT